MRRAFGVVIIFTGLVIGLAAHGQPPPPQGGKPAPAPPKNLQVLPKDMTTAQITSLMRRVAGSLGVDCTHCHVSLTDRASDDKPAKAIGRKMFKMTMQINDEFLKDIGTPAAAGEQKVTCFTCHRGALKPLTAPAAGGH